MREIRLGDEVSHTNAQYIHVISATIGVAANCTYTVYDTRIRSRFRAADGTRERQSVSM